MIHQQCLIVNLRDQVLRLRSTPTRITRSGNVGATRTVKAVAFLPVSFCDSHRSVVNHFRKCGVHIVCNGDDLCIEEGRILIVVECLLDKNPDQPVDSGVLSMMLTSFNDHSDRKDLETIFNETSIELRWKDSTNTDAFTRLAIDEENNEVFKRVASSKKDYHPILSIAVSMNQDLLVKLLLDHGADVNQAEMPFGFSPLHFAAMPVGNLSIASTLLDRGADIKARSSNGSTALHHAAECSSSELVQLLIDEGADVNATDEYERIPLHLCGNSEVVRILLENGADVNRENKGKYTPFLFNLLHPSSNSLAMIKTLLEFGASTDFKVDTKKGLSINDKCLLNAGMGECVLEYVLNRFFVHIDLKYDSQPPEWIEHSDPCNMRIFARHLVRIVSLNLKDGYGFDPAHFWKEERQEEPLSAFKERCETEVTRMKSQPIVGTEFSVCELLPMNEQQMARLLKNESVVFDTEEWKEMFPEYGEMLTCVIEKGRNRHSWEEQAIAGINFLSGGDFKGLPDEIKENIVRRLSIVDIRNVKRACALHS